MICTFIAARYTRSFGKEGRYIMSSATQNFMTSFYLSKKSLNGKLHSINHSPFTAGKRMFAIRLDRKAEARYATTTVVSCVWLS
jgi:hypothetical protein